MLIITLFSVNMLCNVLSASSEREKLKTKDAAPGGFKRKKEKHIGPSLFYNS